MNVRANHHSPLATPAQPAGQQLGTPGRDERAVWLLRALVWVRLSQRIPALFGCCWPPLLGLALLAGCQQSPSNTTSQLSKSASQSARTPEVAPKPPAKASSAESAASYPAVEKSRFPAPARLVAIGDLHGDLTATREVLQLAGAIDAEDRWVGKNLTVVQTGDQLDRGDDERAILDLLSRLATEAKAAGGSLVALNGNHETMNAAGDFRYVTPGAKGTYRGVSESSVSPDLLARVPAEFRDRAAAFFPGGHYAKLLSQRPIIAVVGESLFAHGGVHLMHVKYGIDRINAEVTSWLAGSGKPPSIIQSERSPVWTREFSLPEPSAQACAELREVLRAVGVRRLVVGHTVQEKGVTSACDEQVWRIDVGMSAYYGGDQIMALEIEGDKVRVLSRKKAQLQLAPAAE